MRKQMGQCNVWWHFITQLCIPLGHPITLVNLNIFYYHPWVNKLSLCPYPLVTREHYSTWAVGISCLRRQLWQIGFQNPSAQRKALPKGVAPPKIHLLTSEWQRTLKVSNIRKFLSVQGPVLQHGVALFRDWPQRHCLPFRDSKAGGAWEFHIPWCRGCSCLQFYHLAVQQIMSVHHCTPKRGPQWATGKERVTMWHHVAVQRSKLVVWAPHLVKTCAKEEKGYREVSGLVHHPPGRSVGWHPLIYKPSGARPVVRTRSRSESPVPWKHQEGKQEGPQQRGRGREWDGVSGN